MRLFVLFLNRNTIIMLSMFMCACTWEHTDSSRADSIKNKRPPQVIATTGMIADVAGRIAGNVIRVEPLIRHGIDPHLYRAGRDDIVKLLEADLVLYNGLLLEGRISEVLSSGRIRDKAYAVSDLVSEKYPMRDPGSRKSFDPHIWMDVSIWRESVYPLCRLLTELSPSSKDYFERNADILYEEFGSLHEYGKNLLGEIPHGRRYLVTSHDAFQYFGSAYGLDVYGVQGVSTDSETGVRRINEIVSLIVKNKIPAVFFESGVSTKLLDTIIAGVRAQGGNVSRGGTLYTDSMGPPGTGAETYAGMMRHNFETIYMALKNEEY